MLVIVCQNETSCLILFCYCSQPLTAICKTSPWTENYKAVRQEWSTVVCLQGLNSNLRGQDVTKWKPFYSCIRLPRCCLMWVYKVVFLAGIYTVFIDETIQRDHTNRENYLHQDQAFLWYYFSTHNKLSEVKHPWIKS